MSNRHAAGYFYAPWMKFKGSERWSLGKTGQLINTEWLVEYPFHLQFTLGYIKSGRGWSEGRVKPRNESAGNMMPPKC